MLKHPNLIQNAHICRAKGPKCGLQSAYHQKALSCSIYTLLGQIMKWSCYYDKLLYEEMTVRTYSKIPPFMEILCLRWLQSLLGLFVCHLLRVCVPNNGSLARTLSSYHNTINIELMSFGNTLAKCSSFVFENTIMLSKHYNVAKTLSSC